MSMTTITFMLVWVIAYFVGRTIDSIDSTPLQLTYGISMAALTSFVVHLAERINERRHTTTPGRGEGEHREP